MVRGFYGKRRPAIDPADLDFMYRRHTVPDSWRVYLAARQSHWYRDTWIGDSGSSGFSPDPATHRQHFAMIYVLGLGPFVVFVTGAGGWPRGALKIRDAAIQVLGRDAAPYGSAHPSLAGLPLATGSSAARR